MPPRIEKADVAAQQQSAMTPAAAQKAAGADYYYAHRRKIDFKVPAPSLPIDPATGEVVSAGQHQQHGAAEAGTLL